MDRNDENWMYASQEEIDNMSFQDMIDILKHCYLNEDGTEKTGDFAPRKHMIKVFKTCYELLGKYQKILEIFDRYDKGELTHNMFRLLVGEVIEDGKID